VVENIFSALQAGRAAGYLNSFIGTAGGFGERRGLDVEVDVVGNEEVEIAVAVVVEEGATCIPTSFRLQQTGFRSDVGEGAVAVIAIENVLAVVADDEVVPAVVVVVADTTALTPAAAGKAGFGSDIGEGAVAIVFEEVRDWFLAFGKALETSAVDEEDVDPVILIEVEESYSAACGFEEVTVLVFAAKDSFGIETGLTSDVNEGDAERSSGNRGWRTLWRGTGFGIVGGAGA
jgi:hypothetical protein